MTDNPWDDLPPLPGEPAAIGSDLSPQPNGAADDDAEIARLAKLPLVAYGRERTQAAARLGCPVGLLDSAVRAARGNGAAVTGQGRPLDLPDPVPWPDHIDGAELLDALAKAIRQYTILSERQADAVALWCIYTHCFDAFDFSPKLIIRSVEKRSGKTRLIEVLERIVRRSLFVSGISPAALNNVIEKHVPTMLLDEIDTQMKGATPEMREALTGLINGSYTRSSARRVKNVPMPNGGYDPRAFSTWCPMVLAGIGKLPDTIADRSITIEMKRKRPDEKVKSLRARDGALWDFSRKAARWAAGNLDALGPAAPAAPEQLHDRAADAWAPIFAIADLAGGDWPERARKAAIELSPGEDGESMRMLLLGDIRVAFTALNTDRISSEDLVSYLAGLDDRPWPEFRNGKPISKPQVARLLKPLQISSGTIRLHDGRTPKGYYCAAFEDAFVRWLPPIQCATTSQAKRSAALGENQSATSGNAVAFRNRENPSVSAGCDVVADKIPPDWKERL